MIDLVYLSFGTIVSYHQTLFSLYSFILHHDQSKFRINILTDNQDFFVQHCKALPVEYIALNKETITKMRGEIDFVHRMKIASIEMIFEKGAEKVLYVDSDTLFLKSIYQKALKINQSSSLMHQHEFHFSKASREEKESQTRKLYDLLKNQEINFTNTDKEMAATTQFSSWNAGVVGIDRTNSSLLKQVFELTDRFYKATGHHASEQFSFSYLLERCTTIITCEKEIFHYWPRVQKEKAADYFKDFFESSSFNPSKDISMITIKKAVTEVCRLLCQDPETLFSLSITSFYQREYWKAYSGFLKAFYYGKRDLRSLKDIAHLSVRIVRGRS